MHSFNKQFLSAGDQRFSNLHVHTNHHAVLLTCRPGFRGAGPGWAGILYSNELLVNAAASSGSTPWVARPKTACHFGVTRCTQRLFLPQGLTFPFVQMPFLWVGCLLFIRLRDSASRLERLCFPQWPKPQVAPQISDFGLTFLHSSEVILFHIPFLSLSIRKWAPGKKVHLPVLFPAISSPIPSAVPTRTPGTN